MMERQASYLVCEVEQQWVKDRDCELVVSEVPWAEYPLQTAGVTLLCATLAALACVAHTHRAIVEPSFDREASLKRCQISHQPRLDNQWTHLVERVHLIYLDHTETLDFLHRVYSQRHLVELHIGVMAAVYHCRFLSSKVYVGGVVY